MVSMDKAQRLFIDRLGDAAETDGMSPIAGRLFAALLLAPAPLSLDELAATLGVSKASVSTDARRLLERRIVERITRSGDRKDYYELAPDFFARGIRDRVARWRRIQQLIDGVRADASDLPVAAEDRFETVEAIQSTVLDRIDDALSEWERTPAKRKPRRKRASA